MSTNASAKKTVCDSCREMQWDGCNHVRVGKTKKDHESGAWGNRFENRQARVAWGASNGNNATFPASSCNGQKNRFHK